jgi:hypothetical protein
MSLQSEIVHQCVVMLPLETIVNSCSNRVAVNSFMSLVEELPDGDSGEAMDICGGIMSSPNQWNVPSGSLELYEMKVGRDQSSIGMFMAWSACFCKLMLICCMCICSCV